jgi:hypothetical protein
MAKALNYQGETVRPIVTYTARRPASPRLVGVVERRRGTSSASRSAAKIRALMGSLSDTVVTQPATLLLGASVRGGGVDGIVGSAIEE